MHKTRLNIFFEYFFEASKPPKDKIIQIKAVLIRLDINTRLG